MDLLRPVVVLVLNAKIYEILNEAYLRLLLTEEDEFCLLIGLALALVLLAFIFLEYDRCNS
jgi:hypothetical protein